MNTDHWIQFAQKASEVLSLRSTLVPIWWATNPERARRETELMVSEKEAALRETQLLLLQAPFAFWADLVHGALAGEIDGGFSSASEKADRRLGEPAFRRVFANHERLARLGPE